MNRRLSFSVALLSVLARSNAGTVTCEGTVSQINYHANNGFMLQLSSMNTGVFICDPGRTWTVSGTAYQTTSDECKALVSVFMAAKIAGKSFAIVYFDGDAVPSSCLTFSNWSSANIRYFAWGSD